MDDPEQPCFPAQRRLSTVRIGCNGSWGYSVVLDMRAGWKAVQSHSTANKACHPSVLLMLCPLNVLPHVNGSVFNW